MPLDPGKLALFFAATVALLLTPGPAVLYIVARSASQGRRAGLVSVLGIETGNAVHVAGGALGLAALLAASPVAFSVVKYLGAAYLVALGLGKILRAPPPAALDDSGGESLRTIFAHGVAVAALRPPVAPIV